MDTGESGGDVTAGRDRHETMERVPVGCQSYRLNGPSLTWRHEPGTTNTAGYSSGHESSAW